MSFLARLVSDNSDSLEKWSWGHRPPSLPKKTFYTGSEFSFVATYASDFDLLALLTSEI